MSGPDGEARRLKRVALGAFMLVALLVVGAMASIGILREPRHEGRRLSEWLEDPDVSEVELRAAVRAIGTNGIPYLQDWLLAEATWLEMQVRKVNSRQHWLQFDYSPSIDANIRAMRGFLFLEDFAAPAIPWLIEGINKHDADFSFYAQALLACGGTGREALMAEYPGMTLVEKDQVVRAAYLHLVRDPQLAPFYAGFIKDEDVSVGITAMLLVRNLKARCPQVLFDAISDVQRTGDAVRRETANKVAPELLSKQPGLADPAPEPVETGSTSEIDKQTQDPLQ